MSFRKRLAQEPVTFHFRKMWRFAKGHRHLVVLFLFMSFVANALLLTQPLVFAEFLNEIQDNGLNDSNIVYLILILFLYLAIDLGFWLFHGPARVIENIASFRTERAYRTYLISGVLNLGMSWHSQRDSGDTIDKVNKASEGVRKFTSEVFIIVEVLVRAIGTTAILLYFNIYLGLLTIVLLAVALATIFQFDLRLIPQYKKLNIFDNKISARVFDGLSNIVTVKVLNIEKPVFKGMHQALWAPFDLFKRNRILIEKKWFTGSILFSFIVVLPLSVYIFFLYRNNLPVEVGTISALYVYLSNLIFVYYSFSSDYEEMIKQKAMVQNAEGIEGAFLPKNKIHNDVSREWNTMELSHVSFQYEDTEQTSVHINDVSFNLRKGERIALIGESGSGKTTFLKVIHGLYTNAQAEIAFDGGTPKATNFTDISLKTTLVPQEPEVFSASIRENITLATDYTEREVLHAAGLAEFVSVIKQLPKGLESVINERGVNLSGGQKQRLALARALLFSADKEIMLLDESTSSVDPETEVRIYKNIFETFKGKTIVASIHKMNLLKFFDRIVVFSGGKIVDEGTFDTLLASNKKFKKDWEEYVAKER